MTRSLPGRMLCALALAVGLGVTSPVPADGSGATTRMVVRVVGCNGCRVIPESAPRYVDGTPADHWSGKPATVKDGRAVLVVPRSRTKGLYLMMFDPGAVSEAAPLVVVRYGSLAPGTEVTRRRAARSKRAHHCWAGTRRSRVEWKVRVDRFPSEAYGVSGYGIRPYLVRTRKSFGPAIGTWHGTLGAQDTAYCTW